MPLVLRPQGAAPQPKAASRFLIKPPTNAYLGTPAKQEASRFLIQPPKKEAATFVPQFIYGNAKTDTGNSGPSHSREVERGTRQKVPPGAYGVQAVNATTWSAEPWKKRKNESSWSPNAVSSWSEPANESWSASSWSASDSWSRTTARSAPGVDSTKVPTIFVPSKGRVLRSTRSMEAPDPFAPPQASAEAVAERAESSALAQEIGYAEMMGVSSSKAVSLANLLPPKEANMLPPPPAVVVDEANDLICPTVPMVPFSRKLLPRDGATSFAQGREPLAKRQCVEEASVEADDLICPNVPMVPFSRRLLPRDGDTSFAQGREPLAKRQCVEEASVEVPHGLDGHEANDIICPNVPMVPFSRRLLPRDSNASFAHGAEPLAKRQCVEEASVEADDLICPNVPLVPVSRRLLPRDSNASSAKGAEPLAKRQCVEEASVEVAVWRAQEPEQPPEDAAPPPEDVAQPQEDAAPPPAPSIYGPRDLKRASVVAVWQAQEPEQPLEDAAPPPEDVAQPPEDAAPPPAPSIYGPRDLKLASVAVWQAQEPAQPPEDAAPPPEDVAQPPGDAAPPPAPSIYGLRDLKRALVALGTVDSLMDFRSIPRLARTLRDGFLRELGDVATFEAMTQAFRSAKVDAQRKALVYLVHELLELLAHSTKAGVKARMPAWREACLKAFLEPIGKEVRAMPVEKRAAYVKLGTTWCEGAVCFFKGEQKNRLFEAWDIIPTSA